MKRLIAIILTLLPLAAVKAQTGDFESAEDAVSHMGVGWNLGNTLDSHTNYYNTDIRYMETAWSQFITHEKVMRMMKEAGFKSIRVPVTWYRYMDEEGNVDPVWMARVHEVVDYVMNQGMYCILNVHHDTGATEHAWLVADMDNYNRNKDRFEYLWRQIAEEFKDYGERLLFEGYNEMLDSCWSWGYASARRPAGYSEELARSAYDAINAYAQSFVNAVRSTGGNNLKRNLICSIYCASEGTAGNYDIHLQDPVKKMVMPTEPEGAAAGHQIVEMHYYRNLDNMTEAKKRVDFLMEVLRDYIVDRLGVPVVIGEWGPRTSDNSEAYDTKREALVEFCRYFVQKTQEYGYATLYWRGLSERIARLWPAYNQPEVAEAILKAYYGDDYEPKIPVYDDYVYDYTEVTLMKQYTWIYLNKDRTLDINEYKGVRVELKEKPGRNTLQLRVHRTSGEKPEYNSANRTNLSENALVTTFLFSKDPQWGDVANIEIHRIVAGDSDVVAKVGRCFLLREDGTEEELTLTHRQTALFTDLTAYPKYELDEASTLPPTESANEVAAIVKRTIKANEWSTLCLPFNMSEEQVTETFGEDAKLADFNGYLAEKKNNDEVTGIKINFNTANTIQANRPCLIKVSKNVDEFTVKNVNVAPLAEPVVEHGTAGAPSSLVGTYAAETYVPDNCMFLSSNKFWYSTGLTKMKGYRAYFRFNDVLSDVADRQSGAKVFLIMDNENETTGINTMWDEGADNARQEGWFAPDGRRLYAKPTASGLYILNGKKITIK